MGIKVSSKKYIIDVENSFPCSILSVFYRFFITLHESLYWEGLQGVLWYCNGYLSNNYRVMALDLCSKLH